MNEFFVIPTSAEFFYFEDRQANIVALLDNSGSIVVKYKYDAWGNCKVLNANGIEITDSNNIGILNPFRYRSYYYDHGLNLYYLKTRYYDPEICRFITIDDLAYLDADSINGLNLYAYCTNNPIMYYDPTGNVLDVILDIFSIGWSLYDFIDDQSWKNAGWLALDVVFAVVPFLTGSGGLRAVTKMDDIYDLSKVTTKADDIYLIGQTMNSRVIPEALNLGVDWYHGFKYYNEIANISKPLANLFGYIDNMAFIARKSFSGAKFIDMGFDATRTLSSMHKHGKLGVEIFSRFTIYSERFVSIMFRKKNIVRILRRFYESFFGGEK